MHNKQSFIEKIVTYEPVLISDLLAFISSIILLIITWKSVSNAKKSNEITLDSLKISEETLKLQKQQFNENIKPVLVMYFPDVMTEEKSHFNESWVAENVSMLFGDYRFSIKNTSKNIAYNVRVYLYLYAENETWMKHKDNGYKDLGLIFTTNGSYHLDSNEKLKNTIPYHYFKGKMKNFYTDIYIIVSYENKIGDVYEEGYVLRQMGHVYGESHVTVSFEPKSMEVVKLKETVLNQKEFLEKHFEKDLFYYFVPK
ncbi:hypothetical protein [Jeotgalicoccus sp. ATCC 8456]|uniref:hypothetical protein n=1 Tax=Jeotgalicoccus sp. ATCC 8456 TaxID=946435 RepID=UPI0018E5FAEA|nr:hypothetical protein [Jeotgalicoccus sp. ATCC 8456]QQD84554.1 hypothetical protein JEM45_07935 [Jeotgalicoccus sp. ATCC 8456]